jgi:hypothetical protein
VTKTKRTGFKARENRENPVHDRGTEGVKQRCCTETEKLGRDVRPGEKKEDEEGRGVGEARDQGVALFHSHDVEVCSSVT